MPTLGSDGGFQADNRGGLIDEQGNTIVTADTAFAASPLGIAARTQALYGIPNANFNLTPPDPDSPIVANQNDLPYWSIEELSDGVMTATTIFDATTQTWGVQIDPGTAATGSSLALTTRSYLITDDNLALRQKALAVLSKIGTAAVSTEWNLQLSAIYYDSTDTALSTAVIGTALDTGTWTSFAGTTTPGGSAINAAAQYVDLTFTLTTTAAVTGSAKATIKSLLLTTSSPTTGGGLLITETFTAGTTWTKPTGVDYLVAALVVGAGGGGGAGGAAHGTANPAAQVLYTQGGGGGGGGGGAWSFVQNLYLADASYSIGIGAGGAGGTSVSYTKGIGTAAVGTAISGGSGGVGGATTFGTVITAGGGGGGTGGSARTDSTSNLLSPAAAGTPGVPTASIYGAENYSGGTGGSGTTPTTNNAIQSTAPFTFAIYPYVSTPSNGQNGGTSTISGTSTASAGGSATNAAIGFSGGGAASPTVQVSYNGSTGNGGVVVGTSFAAKDNGGGGGAGASAGVYFSGTAGTVSVTGGNGGNAASNSGGGGAAGGGAATKNLASNINGYRFVQSGAGGNGASGYVVIAYIA